MGSKTERRLNERERAVGEILDTFVGNDAGRSCSFQSTQPGTIFASRNGDVPRPAASVMKIPLIMSIYAPGGANRTERRARYKIKEFQKTRYVSILAAFDPNHELTLAEICKLAIITSDNPLAVFLQSHTSFERVNKLLTSICGDFGNTMATGFSEEELGPKNRANILTANACLRVLNALEQGSRYREVLTALENNLRNNRIPARLPETAVVAHKTGSLEGVANDAGIVRDSGVHFRVVFLTDRQPDTEKTSADIAHCSARLFELVSNWTLARS
jgi:beta-lactamase class A